MQPAPALRPSLSVVVWGRIRRVWPTTEAAHRPFRPRLTCRLSPPQFGAAFSMAVSVFTHLSVEVYLLIILVSILRLGRLHELALALAIHWLLLLLLGQASSVRGCSQVEAASAASPTGTKSGSQTGCQGAANSDPSPPIASGCMHLCRSCIRPKSCSWTWKKCAQEGC